METLIESSIHGHIAENPVLIEMNIVVDYVDIRCSFRDKR